MEITGSIRNGGQKIKSSSLFIQLDRLGLLTPTDKTIIATFENHITSIPNTKLSKSSRSKLLEQLKDEPNISEKIKTRIEKSLSDSKKEVYEPTSRSKIQELIDELMDKNHMSIRVWNGDLENLFNDSLYDQSIREARTLYGDNKVLHGIYLASNTPVGRIPKPIVDVINQLKSLETTNSY